MKIKKAIYLFCALLFFVLANSAAAQDRIITTEGKTIHGNVRKVRDEKITYRRYFHKYEIKSDKVLYIIDENGAKKIINPITEAKNYKNYNQLAKKQAVPVNDTLAKKTGAEQFHPHYIERLGNNFRIDTNKIVGTGKVNKLVALSPNPSVQLSLKVAQTMRKFLIISKIASYPSSMGGAFATWHTCESLFKELKDGPAPVGSYVKAGLSFLGTLTMPITSAILKKKKNKLYDKALTGYSAGN